MSNFDPTRLATRLAQRPRRAIQLAGYSESAVLVPIVRQPGAPDRLLFTVRHADLAHHAGQISFPGGKRDPEDTDAASTAIRETSEELGIEPAAVEVLGLLDDIPTHTRFVITPVVAQLRGPLRIHPNVAEVAEVFASDLDRLLDGSVYKSGGMKAFLGVTYTMHEYHWGVHRIWGATAQMVYQLLGVLREHS